MQGAQVWETAKLALLLRRKSTMNVTYLALCSNELGWMRVP